jgi:hypothetical protein
MRQTLMVGCFLSAAVLSLTTWLMAMRAGVGALQRMDRMPS